MTRVEFFFNVEDKLEKTAELCEKALDKGRELMIFTQGDAMDDALQQRLWQQSATSFLVSTKADKTMGQHTSIVVTDCADHLVQDDILINLQAQQPPFFSRFRYLVELVGNDDVDKAAGRVKFRFYRDRGYDIKSTDMAERK
ncbi:MAG: DNA polymerase III subunit chi [Methylotenera sp.]|nr:DNA polymerase III subunit chi [Methylotenera sp.]MSP99567.1 DNA polymerase III subunit chi [Methylotenera sp.]